MAKTQRDVRDIQAAAACELAGQALTLTDDPSMDHIVALSRIRQLVEVLESTATYLLLQKGFTWEVLGAQLDGVSRQSFHRRLSRRIDKLLSLPAEQVQYQENRAGREITSVLTSGSWVNQLQDIAQLISDTAEHQYHPEVVKHHRSA